MNDLKQQVAMLEKRSDDLREEVKTLYSQRNVRALVCSFNVFVEHTKQRKQITYVLSSWKTRDGFLYGRIEL
jgi:hypothetical protein